MTNANRKTPKDLASEENYASVVEFLEQKQQEKLFNAAKQGNLVNVRSFISQGANVDSRDYNKLTPLYFVTVNGHIKLQYLLEKDANIDSRDRNNVTPLHLATYNGLLKLVDYLLEKEANILAKNNYDAAFHLEVRNKEEIIKLILDKFKETPGNVIQHIDAQDTEGNTPLMWAAESGRINAAQILLEYGASAEVKNKDGMTALHWTAQNGHLLVAKLLVENGADIHAIDNNGRKPMHVAALHGYLNVIKLFLSSGVSVDDIDRDGWTPLHYAVCNREPELVNFLLIRGADIDARGKSGRNAFTLSMAVEKVIQDSVQLDIDFVTAYIEQMYYRGFEMLPDCLKRSYNSAKELYSEGRYKEALKDFVFVFSLQNKASFLGPNHPDTLVTRMNIAVVFSKLDKYEEALKILKEVLNIQKGLKDLGPYHRDTLTTHHNIAEVYYKQGKYKDALELYERVLKKRKGILKANHPDILISRFHIARVLNIQGKDNRALKMFREIFKLQCRILGTDHPDSLKTQHSIAFTFYKLKKYEQAFFTIQEILEKGRIVLGSRHPDHLTTNHVSAQILLQIGCHEDALQLLKDIVQAQEEILGLDHSDTLATRHDIARAFYLQCKTQQALDIFREVYEKRKEVLGSDHLYTLYTYNVIRSKESKCSIQHYGKPELNLSEFLSSYISHAEIESVRQGLYLPSFRRRRLNIGGICAAITLGLSQAILLQSAQSFLNNLETSAEIYERIAQGKQISKREEGEVFAFNKLLSVFDEDIVSGSLPSYVTHTWDFKKLGDLSNFLAGIKGDFVIHLNTLEHVVAIYRTDDNYTYFDCNVAFVRGLKSADQLIEVVEKLVESVGYEIDETGVFLVEHFDVDGANNEIPDEYKEVLTKEIKTERHRLTEQDKELGLLEIKGQEVSRVQLYDVGTKINVKGSVPLLINADMNLSSEKFQDLLDKKEVSMTAREYLGNLKCGKNIDEVTKVITFIGSKREVEKAEQNREQKRSLLEQLVKEAINHILSDVSLTKASRLKSKLPEKADDKPRTGWLIDDLKIIGGMTEHAAATVECVKEDFKRALKEGWKTGPVMDSQEMLIEYVRESIGFPATEAVLIVYLDAQYRLIRDEMHFGTIDEVLLYEIKMVKKALSMEAASIILAHNHPEGSLEPSEDDKVMTRQLVSVCRGVGIELGDHIIVTDKGYCSFKERELL